MAAPAPATRARSAATKRTVGLGSGFSIGLALTAAWAAPPAAALRVPVAPVVGRSTIARCQGRAEGLRGAKRTWPEKRRQAAQPQAIVAAARRERSVSFKSVALVLATSSAPRRTRVAR